ncbi:uncharacterized protein LOC128951257 [Oppia nitens]|uniref:uncharacterized protein LOC128951257 n=1 Tax=Oppia nitens TaxID=1686743 RepID=UPI0023DC6259|nr:uncharacterized protein LOC128951257 [Oppia nitens]
MKVYLAIVLLLALVVIIYSNSTPVNNVDNNIWDKLKTGKDYVKLIEKFNVKAWHFLECMGKDWCEHCVSPTLGCLKNESIVGCIELIACEAKDAFSCAQKLK